MTDPWKMLVACLLMIRCSSQAHTPLTHLFHTHFTLCQHPVNKSDT